MYILFFLVFSKVDLKKISIKILKERKIDERVAKFQTYF